MCLECLYFTRIYCSLRCQKFMCSVTHHTTNCEKSDLLISNNQHVEIHGLGETPGALQLWDPGSIPGGGKHFFSSKIFFPLNLPRQTLDPGSSSRVRIESMPTCPNFFYLWFCFRPCVCFCMQNLQIVKTFSRFLILYVGYKNCSSCGKENTW